MWSSIQQAPIFITLLMAACSVHAGRPRFQISPGTCSLYDPAQQTKRGRSYIGGNISVTEIIFAAYNPISRRPFGGSQDNGTPVVLNNDGDAEDITTGDGQVHTSRIELVSPHAPPPFCRQ